MKAARLRLSVELVAKALGLPSEAEIVNAWQDTEDMASRTLSLCILGAGEEVAEGAVIKVMDIGQLIDVTTRDESGPTFIIYPPGVPVDQQDAVRVACDKLMEGQ